MLLSGGIAFISISGSLTGLEGQGISSSSDGEIDGGRLGTAGTIIWIAEDITRSRGGWDFGTG